MLLKGRYFPLVDSGQKRSTIRTWRHCRLCSGQQTTLHNYRRFIPIVVTDVRHVRADLLNDDDARRDGFTSLEALRLALGVPPDTMVWVIGFQPLIE